MKCKFFVLLAATALTSASVSLAAPAMSPVYGDWGFDAPGMDSAVKPGDDFFKYANGGWDARTAIPADKAGYGVDYVMADAAEQHVHGILEADPANGDADAQKIHAAWLAFMDEAKVEALGARPIAPDLAAIRAAKDRAGIAALMGRENVGFQASLFTADLEPDEKNPGRYAAYISQAGLGLPDRDYYLTPSFAEKKRAYQAYIAQLLTLAGWDDPAASAAAVVDFETKVAEASWTRAERRDSRSGTTRGCPSLQHDGIGCLAHRRCTIRCRRPSWRPPRRASTGPPGCRPRASAPRRA